MVRIAFAVILLTSVLSALPAHGSRQTRPFAGIGLLVIRPLTTESTDAGDLIPVYEDPAIKRVAELKATSLPGLFTAIRVSSGNYATVVMDKKGDWLKIAYDNADREGWIEMKKYWEYIPWRDFLKGRHAVLLPKLRGSDYKLRVECSDISEPLADIPPLGDFQVIEVDGDWVKVRTGQSAEGCIRWRGGDGRFLISPGENGP
jgi:hypothetical protein